MTERERLNIDRAAYRAFCRRYGDAWEQYFPEGARARRRRHRLEANCKVHQFMADPMTEHYGIGADMAPHCECELCREVGP